MCLLPFWGHCVLVDLNKCDLSISLTFFKVRIPLLACGFIMGWGSVSFHYRVTVTLTSDLISSIIVSEAYLLHYMR